MMDASHPSTSPLRRYAVPMAALLLLAATAAAAYLSLFSSFAPYDDEGYVMLSLKTFMAGEPLYDETYSQYGPAYYFLNSWLHRLFHWEVSHDVARLKTLGIWLVTAASVALFSCALTGSRLVLLISYLAAYFHLDRLGTEPSHPQELCFLAIAMTLLLALTIRPGRRNTLSFACLGFIAGLVVMTKINIGVFLLTAVSLAGLYQAQRGLVRTTLLTIVGVGAVLLPFVILGQHALSLEHLQLPAVTIIGLGGVALALQSINRVPVAPGNAEPLSSIFTCWAACVTTSLAFAGLALAHGTSVSSLLDGMIFQHRQFFENCFEPPPTFFAAVWVALAGVLAIHWLSKGHQGIYRTVILGALTLFLAVSLRYLTDSFHRIEHGADDRGQAALLLNFLPPFAWLVLLPLAPKVRGDIRAADVRNVTPTDEQARCAFSRIFLAFLAVVLPLTVYPIPGTQVAMGSLPLLVILILTLSDASWQTSLRSDDALLLRRGLAFVTVLCLAAMIGRSTQLSRQYSRYQPLDLNGASRLRLPPGFVQQVHWINDQLSDRASTFVCLQSGFNSLYLWFQIDPPTGLNATTWQSLLRDDQQQEVVEQLKAAPRPVVVWNTGEDPPTEKPGPLRAFVEKNFRPVAAHNSVEVWIRRDAI